MAKKILVLALALVALALVLTATAYVAYYEGRQQGDIHGWETGYSWGFEKGLHEGALNVRIRTEIEKSGIPASAFDAGFERGVSTSKAGGTRWP